MRRIFSSAFFQVSTLTVLLTLLTALPAATQEGDGTTPVAPADTVSDDEKPSGRLRISIDKSGISIEGDIRSDRDSGKWLELHDDRGPYREKGEGIVKFGKSVFVAGDEIVRGDLVIFGGNAIIEGRVTGDVFVVGGNIRLRSGAEIKGDAMVIGGVLEEDDDVVIHGERILFDDIMPGWGFGSLFIEAPWISWVLLPVMFFIQLVMSFLVLLFLRDRIGVGVDHASSNFLKSFGTGMLTSVIGLFALLIVMIPLVITVIGIPLAILLVVSCCGVFIIAWTVFALSLGRIVVERINARSSSPFLFVFVGALIIYMPVVISLAFWATPLDALGPFALAFMALSLFLSVFAYVSGLGALVLSRFGSRPLDARSAPEASSPATY